MSRLRPRIAPCLVLAGACALTSFAASAASAASVTGTPAASAAQELKERDHEALGKQIGEFLENQDDTKKQEKAREKLEEALAKIGKKKAGKDGDPVRAALSMTKDLEQAMYRANSYKNIKGGKVHDGENKGVEFAVWLPDDYKSNGEPWPLILLIPGLEGGKPMKPDLFLTEYWTEAEVRAGAILAAVQMPEDISRWADASPTDSGAANLLHTLAGVRDTYAVDRDRVFVAGREVGVEAALAQVSRFPHLFAGVIGKAGDVGKVGFENFRNVPTFLQGGGAEATAFAEAIKTAGYDNCTLKPEAPMSELWSWIQDTKRDSNPTHITLRPGSPIPNKAYWLEVPASEGSDVVDAVADRDTNTITITSPQQRGSVVIFFNDLIVDLDKPVKVVLNGREEELVIPRSLDDFLSLLLRGTSDAGKLYVAFRRFDIPG